MASRLPLHWLMLGAGAIYSELSPQQRTTVLPAAAAFLIRPRCL
jgi:hypothetical protein|eukprot:SAG25_NODE_1186_length_3666_cov_9.128399_1_plen_44_part_00